MESNPQEVNQPLPVKSEMSQSPKRNRIIGILNILFGILLSLTPISLLVFVVPQLQSLNSQFNLETSLGEAYFVVMLLILICFLNIATGILNMRCAAPSQNLFRIGLTGLLTLFLFTPITFAVAIHSILSPLYNLTQDINSNLSTPTPTPAGGPTANWKTYTNIKYEYSVKYPNDWSVGGTGPGQSEDFIQNSWLIGLRGPKDCEKTIKHCGNIDISVTELNPTESTRSAKEIWLNDRTKYMIPDIKTEEKIELNGIKALKISYIYNFLGGQTSKSHAPVDFITVVAIHNSKMYTIDIRELLYPKDKTFDYDNATFNQWQHTALFDRVVSTFIFSDSTTVDTSNWKTYTNTKVGFSLLYPSNYDRPALPDGSETPYYATGTEEKANIIFLSGKKHFTIHIFPFTGTVSQIIDLKKKEDTTILPYWSGDKPTDRIFETPIADTKAQWYKTNSVEKNDYYIQVYFVGNNHGFIVDSWNSNRDELKRILSTFEFLDSEFLQSGQASLE